MDSNREHYKYQAFTISKSYITKQSLRGDSIVFTFNHPGFITHNDIIFKIVELQNAPESLIRPSLRAIDRIELFYNNKCIGDRGYLLDKVFSDNGIFKLTDVFPGIRFSLYNTIAEKRIMIRFQTVFEPYKFKEFAVEYNTHSQVLFDGLFYKFRDCLIPKDCLTYYTENENDKIKLYFTDKTTKEIKEIRELKNKFTIYLNDEKIDPEHSIEALNKRGHHYILLNNENEIENELPTEKEMFYLQQNLKF